MKQFVLSLLFVAGVSGASSGAGLAPRCPSLPPRTPMPLEATPSPVEIPDWRQRVGVLTKQVSERDLSRVRVAFVGDSITQSWEPITWDLFWSSYEPLNLGLWGDLTQGVLWRLQNGQWPAGLNPELAVILIGTNNAGWRSRPENTALGIAEIIRFIQSRSPATRVLLLGILPRGTNAAAPERIVNTRVNALIRQCADNESVFYLDPGRAMIDGSGQLSTNVMFDYLHPTMVGYAILGAGIYSEVRRIIGR